MSLRLIKEPYDFNEDDRNAKTITFQRNCARASCILDTSLLSTSTRGYPGKVPRAVKSKCPRIVNAASGSSVATYRLFRH
ncbi:PREDICTED: uncharacterized protein LOC108768057 isoform X2 [Trachymyrmex cornetzi]|uniref:uncharacterized protein LOC108768057 isoform X2 n=1 Tax=Trachymyrmex cornetzi TaxID=471704 RepID=UPI00084F7D4E|nr:PREDICTED: uncharacterized protein LOC108768057 isoform X2 [Trachymyrmex cornetzi]